MTNPFGSVGAPSKAPIGDEGVIAYAEQMNREHPNAPYIWRAVDRWHEGEGRMVKFLEVIRKTALRNAGTRVTPAEMQEILGRTRYLDAAE